MKEKMMFYLRDVSCIVVMECFCSLVFYKFFDAKKSDGEMAI